MIRHSLQRAALPMCLLAVWLVLQGTFAPGEIVLGLALSVALVRAAAPLRPRHAFPRRPGVALALLGRVLIDIAHSNLMVARLIWSRPGRQPSPGFIHIPLALRDPNALAALACIITSTPGTVWVDLSHDHVLTLHVLDLRDESVWSRTIRQHYESRLKEIFECNP